MIRCNSLLWFFGAFYQEPTRTAYERVMASWLMGQRTHTARPAAVVSDETTTPPSFFASSFASASSRWTNERPPGVGLIRSFTLPFPIDDCALDRLSRLDEAVRCKSLTAIHHHRPANRPLSPQQTDTRGPVKSSGSGGASTQARQPPHVDDVPAPRQAPSLGDDVRTYVWMGPSFPPLLLLGHGRRPTRNTYTASYVLRSGRSTTRGAAGPNPGRRSWSSRTGWRIWRWWG